MRTWVCRAALAFGAAAVTVGAAFLGGQGLGWGLELNVHLVEYSFLWSGWMVSGRGAYCVFDQGLGRGCAAS